MMKTEIVSQHIVVIDINIHVVYSRRIELECDTWRINVIYAFTECSLPRKSSRTNGAYKRQ